MIQQEQSYVAGNNVFCVYNAESVDLIHEHAKRSKESYQKLLKYQL